jgi:hypothetical protein
LIERFRDSGGVERHYDFQRWRSGNIGALFLHRMTVRRSRLHRSLCPNFESPDREKDKNWNLTAREKVCGDSFSELKDWALTNDVEMIYCRNCNPIPEHLD